MLHEESQMLDSLGLSEEGLELAHKMISDLPT